MKGSNKVQTSFTCLWTPCGALVIDEVAQGAAALYHAVALRSCYGHTAAYGLEVKDYPEPAEVFGAMPVAVGCGDELQLPPIPHSSNMFAEQSSNYRAHGRTGHIHAKGLCVSTQHNGKIHRSNIDLYPYRHAMRHRRSRGE